LLTGRAIAIAATVMLAVPWASATSQSKQQEEPVGHTPISYRFGNDDSGPLNARLGAFKRRRSIADQIPESVMHSRLADRLVSLVENPQPAAARGEARLLFDESRDDSPSNGERGRMYLIPTSDGRVCLLAVGLVAACYAGTSQGVSFQASQPKEDGPIYVTGIATDDVVSISVRTALGDTNGSMGQSSFFAQVEAGDSALSLVVHHDDGTDDEIVIRG
jgi:hypothetical protein